MTKQSRSAYAAGIIDAAGEFSIVGNPTSEEEFVRVVVSNPKPVLKQIARSFGGQISKHEDGKSWLLIISGNRSMENFILAVLPYLITKRLEAQSALNRLRANASHSKSPTTNTQEFANADKIESELLGDEQSESTVMPVP